jgi:UDP-N-acetylmuramoyl-tripeptide--D-alanyl-D-alanine ligase
VIALRLSDVAELCEGIVAPVSDRDLVVAGPVVADSRLAECGSLFVAVAGERADGHDFVGQARSAGAVAAIASRPVDAPAVMVDDTVRALGLLAAGYLRRLTPTVVAVTGSSGKTSTKDLLSQLLAGRGPTVAPAGSFNTEVGLPLTVLRAERGTQFLALEMSARGLGHIAYLCRIAPPAIGVVLNVGAAHLGEFGSRQSVARAKGELVEALPAEGLAVLNADDDAVAAMRSRTAARVVTFGHSPDADVQASDVRLDALARPRFRLRSKESVIDVSLALHGAHQVSNALAVAAVGLEIGMALADVGTALNSAVPISRWRMEVSTSPQGVTVVNDAYNANPESMRAALAALAAMRPRGGGERRSWAVLGHMAELGELSESAHREVGAVAAGVGIDRLVVVGADAAAIAEGARGAGMPASAIERVATAEEAAALLASQVRATDIVLVKASRVVDLQRVAQQLLVDATGASTGAGAAG